MFADLHNHTCLSPCGSSDLTPRRLLELGAARGLKLMALTDHNSSLNCPAFAKLSARYGIIPIFGMEAATAEDIHVLCLFTSLEACMDFNEYAGSLISAFHYIPDSATEQIYVDDEDNIEGKIEYYLINPLDISINKIGAKVIEYGGIVIPAHVDRQAFSMTSELGLIVEGPWCALECVRIPPVLNGARLVTLDLPLITSSDAHFPEYVARRYCELDVSTGELQPGGPGTAADMAALKRALAKRPKH